jgi:alkyl hydroperoxide reductase subunit AhpF
MANNIMAVPTVFVDGERKFVGFPFKEENLLASIEKALGR